MKGKAILAVLCAVPVMGLAAEPGVTGPVSGFVFDSSTHALRPVLGRPGSAYVSAPLSAEFDGAAVSPEGSTALAVRGGELFAIRGLKAGQTEVLAIEGGIAGAGLFAWSASGSYVAVYSAEARQAQILRGTTVVATIGLDFEQVLSLAVDDEGNLVAGAAGGVYLAARDAAPRLLVQAARPVSLAIAGESVFAVDSDGKQVWEIAAYRGTPAPQLLAADLDSPVAAAVAGRRLFVADAARQTIAIIDTLSRATTGSVALDFAPSRVQRFGDPALLLLNDGGEGQPYYVLDASDSAVYFVPAGREQ